MQWIQIYDPFGRWWLSTLVAALPIMVLFGLRGGFKVKPHVFVLHETLGTTAILGGAMIIGSAVCFSWPTKAGVIA